MVRLVLNGALGRMGRTVLSILEGEEGFRLVAALEHEGHPALGEDVGTAAGMSSRGLPLGSRMPSAGEADVLLDFSVAGAVAGRMRECLAARVAAVVCTTGLDAEAEAAIDDLAAVAPVLVAANTSTGITLLRRLVREATRALGPGYDVEIIELHHRHKRDAPSGTALALAAEVKEGGGPERLEHGRQGEVGERPRDVVGVHAVRLGDVVGEHRVIFAGAGERLELAHVAHTRETFARGALRAARALAIRPAGRCRMEDILFAER